MHSLRRDSYVPIANAMQSLRRNSNAPAPFAMQTSRRNSFVNDMRVADQALAHVDHIAIDLHWGENRADGALIKLQGFEVGAIGKARERLDYLLQHMRCVRTLTINLATSRTIELETLIEKLLDAENVRLEVLHVRRRYVGQRCELLADLVAANVETLRVVSKLGLSEIDGLNEKTRLDRLSLMNFDLVDARDGELESPQLVERTRTALRRLAVSGATFAHLSYTTYSGFDIASNPAHLMLRQCGVTSLRLTMQKGSPIGSLTFGESPILLPALQRLELVGLMNAPRERLNALFPKLEYYNVETDEFESVDDQSSCSSEDGHSRTASFSSSTSPRSEMIMPPRPFYNWPNRRNRCISNVY